MILVSHDRYLLSRVCDRIFEITPGQLCEYNSGFEEYLAAKRAKVQAEQEAQAEIKQQKAKEEAEKKNAAAYRSKEQRAKDAKRRSRIRELEKLISELEVKMAAVQEEMTSPEAAADYVLMNEKCAEYEQLKQQSSDYSDEWLMLSEEDEG